MANRSVKIFGREPAAIVGLIEAGLVLAIAFGLSLSNSQVALIIAVVVAVFGVYTAYVTKDTLLGVVVGLTKAVLALLIGFGIDVDPELAAAITGFVTVSLGFWQRHETSPIDAPTFREARNAHTA